MVLDHLLRERLGVRIRLLRERKLARLDLEHVADRDLVHEILRRWRAGGRRGLGESNRSEEPASGRDNQGFVHETLHGLVLLYLLIRLNNLCLRRTIPVSTAALYSTRPHKSERIQKPRRAGDLVTEAKCRVTSDR